MGRAPLPGFDERCLILLLALALDAAVGDPDSAWRRVPHPVVILGRAIGWLDRGFNDAARSGPARRARGLLAALLVPLAGAAAALLVSGGLAGLPGGWAVEAVLAATLIAQRSLYDHVAAVARALEQGGLEGGRAAVARIVGRDPASLDGSGVSRAAIESLAENFCDGVVAPVFWYLVAGLPGLVAYKAINTADSMVGHRTPRHEAYGWASARLDDLLNLVPARLSGLLVALAAWTTGRAGGNALRAMRRDASRHTSPNAGWPEAAMAGALGVALAGPRLYGGTRVEAAWMNEGGRTGAGAADIQAALRVFVAACLAQAALVGTAAALL